MGEHQHDTGGSTLRAERARLVIALGSAILLLVLLASTAGSPIASTPRRDVDYTNTLQSRGSVGQSVDASSASQPPRVIGDAPLWISALVTLLLVGVALAVLWAVGRWLRQALQARRDRSAQAVSDAAPPAAVTARVLLDDSVLHWQALDEGEPTEAIIAMWVALERSVGRAGIERRPAETSSELTLRALHGLPMDGAAVRSLAELYREARFSRNPLTDSDRAAAREALQQIHDSLGTGGRPSPEHGGLA